MLCMKTKPWAWGTEDKAARPITSTSHSIAAAWRGTKTFHTWKSAACKGSFAPQGEGRHPFHVGIATETIGGKQYTAPSASADIPLLVCDDWMVVFSQALWLDWKELVAGSSELDQYTDRVNIWLNASVHVLWAWAEDVLWSAPLRRKSEVCTGDVEWH